MTTQRQAIGQLSRLYVEYAPLLDRLISATPNNFQAAVREEQRIAPLIWELGKTAFGPAKGANLEILKHDVSECSEILEVEPFNEEHRVSLIGCCVRSKRLGQYLREAKSTQEPDKMKRAAEEFSRLVATLNRPLRRGEQAKLCRKIDSKFSLVEGGTKKAIKRYY